MSNVFLFANNAGSTLAGAINSTATTALLAAGTGVLFPAPGSGQQFAMTFISASNNLLKEIVYVTSISGDTITMVRGQEGTNALSWSAGDFANALITAGMLQSMTQYGQLPITSVAGNPNGVLAGTAGTPGTNGFPSLAFDVTNLIGYFCTATGSSSTAVWSPMSGQAINFKGGTSTGTANAQTVTPVTPGGFSAASGVSLTFTPGATNTGDTFLTAGSTGSIECKKVSGASLVNFAGNEFTINVPVTVVSNGTYWVLQTSSLGALGLLNIGYGLKNDGSGNGAVTPTTLPLIAGTSGVRASAAGGASSVTIALQEAILGVALGGNTYKISSPSLSFNGSGTGANGMDTGSLPISGYLDLYAIVNGAGTVATLGCNNATSGGASVYSFGHMPAGYIASAFLGTYPTDGSGHVIAFAQINREVFLKNFVVAASNLATGTTSLTSLSIASSVPPNAILVSGNMGSTSSSGSNAGLLGSIAGDASGTGAQIMINDNGPGSAPNIAPDATLYGAGPFRDIPLLTAQTIFYTWNANGSAGKINIQSYKF